MNSPSPFEVSRLIGNNLAGAFQKRQEENAIESILSKAMQSEDPDVMQQSIGKILSGVSPERQGAAIQYLHGAYNNIQKKNELARRTQAEIQAGVTPGLDPRLQAQELKNKNDLMKPKDQKFLKEQQDELQIKQVGQQAFNSLSELLKKGNVGRGSGLIASLPFATETQEDTGKFTSLTGALEAMLVDKVSRGTLSNTRFNYITENLLPKPNDSQATIKGKLIGLAEILELDPSSLIGDVPIEESSKKRPSLSSFER